MLNKIVDALNRRSDLAGWTVRHLINQGTQVYAVPNQTEAQRAVGSNNTKSMFFVRRRVLTEMKQWAAAMRPFSRAGISSPRSKKRY